MAMKRFYDFSNQEKIAFLLEVKNYYLHLCEINEFHGLCYSVFKVLENRGYNHSILPSQFMGYEIWNYKYAGLENLSIDGYWWPIEDVESRIEFINRLICLYNVQIYNGGI